MVYDRENKKRFVSHLNCFIIVFHGVYIILITEFFISFILHRFCLLPCWLSFSRMSNFIIVISSCVCSSIVSTELIFALLCLLRQRLTTSKKRNQFFFIHTEKYRFSAVYAYLYFFWCHPIMKISSMYFN